MKKIVLLVFCVYSFIMFSQDSTKTIKPKRTIFNEVGINASLLLRQVFGSSASSITPLPYDLTYKLIIKKTAVRVGLGINIKNTTTINTSYSSNYQTTPDLLLPNYTNSTSYYYRVGFEYRFRISRKFLVYTGVDIVGQSSNTKLQNNYMNNNLPNSYDYSKTNSTITSSGVGAGPVIGIQFYCTKRFSIYTEIPFYYMKTTQNTQTNQYANSYPSSSSNYVQTYSGTTQHITTSTFSITIPATLYMAVKF